MPKPLRTILDETTNKNLDEGQSLSRVWQHLQKRHVGTISASRGEHDEKENHRRNTALAHDLKKAGVGFVHVKGGFIENKGQKGEKHVKEHSFLVHHHDHEHLKKTLTTLGHKYNQDSVTLKHKDHPSAKLIGTTHRKVDGPAHGEEMDIGHFHPNVKNPYGHTILKKGKGRTFSYTESVHDEDGNLLWKIPTPL